MINSGQNCLMRVITDHVSFPYRFGYVNFLMKCIAYIVCQKIDIFAKVGDFRQKLKYWLIIEI